MITLIDEKINSISQKSYDNSINSLELHQLQCCCGHHGCLIHHGRYSRTIKVNGALLRLKICRVFCKACKHTHSILPSSIVPYSQIPLEKQAAIIECAEGRSDLNTVLDAVVDESNVRSVLRSYRKYWQERLRYAAIFIRPLPELTRQCFQTFSRQFMQIKHTPNQLFVRPT